MELWDMYDINRQKTGVVINRNLPMEQGFYRLVVHICIFNKKGEMLIQQRHINKKNWAGAWDVTVGGCAQAGETSQDAIRREIFEELGLDIDMSGERAYLTINFDDGYDDYYLITKDVDLNSIKFRDNEVQAVKWASEGEILKMIKNGTFVTYYSTFISDLFEMRKKRGVFRD